jgi:hypothetical protein
MSGAPAYPPMGAQPMGQPGGGSFLGTAAAAAAGVIGGSLLLSGIRNIMGPHGGAQAAFDPAAGGGSSPWSGGSGSIADSDLSRQAGLDDLGRNPAGGGVASDTRQGLFDDGGDVGGDDPGAADFGDGSFDFDDGGDGDE